MLYTCKHIKNSTMKKVTLILLTLVLFNCSNDDSPLQQEQQQIIPEATILGRWSLLGFEDNIRYEFTDQGKLFTIYGVDGVFPTLEEFNQENPGLTGLDWYYEDDVLVVDLNFGNYSRLTPQFVCDNYVVRWIDEDGGLFGFYYREDFDISSCQEVQ